MAAREAVSLKMSNRQRQQQVAASATLLAAGDLQRSLVAAKASRDGIRSRQVAADEENLGLLRRERELKAIIAADRSGGGVQHQRAVAELEGLQEDMATLSRRIEKLNGEFAAADGRVTQLVSQSAALRNQVPEATAALEAGNEERRAVSERRVEQERVDASKLSRRQWLAMRRTQRAAERDALEVEAKVAETRRLRASAAQRLWETLAAEQQLQQAASDLVKEQSDKRARAVVGLRRSLMAVEDEVGAAAERTRKARDRRAARQQSEKDALLARGENPHEVWRRREMEGRRRAMELAGAEAVSASRLALASKMVDEQEAERKRDAERRRRDEAVAASRFQGSTEGRNQRTEAYLASRTIGNSTIIDPTGKLGRIDPSAVTVTRTAALGTGSVANTRPDVLEQQARRRDMRGVAPDLTWVPKRARAALAAEAAEGNARAGGAEEGVARRHAQEAAEVAAGGGGLAAALGRTMEAAGLTGDDIDPATGLPPPLPKRQARTFAELSVLEQRLMRQARERQRANLTQEQVVLGRRFKGRAFIASPAVIDFSDYKPGSTHTFTFTLTNASYSFASFRLGKLPDSVCDLFDVQHTPPGRMSAGTSCKVRVTFKPPGSFLRDIDVELPVLASTGPCPVPLRATYKKAWPVIPRPVLELPPCVRGESTRAVLEVRNEGALPFEWSATPADGEASLEEVVGAPAGADGELGAGAVVAHATRGVLPPYSSRRIPFKFQPRRHTPLGAFDRLLIFRFGIPEDSASEQVRAGSTDLLGSQEVLFKCTVQPLPLYVAPAVVDLGVCLYGKVYRGVIHVRNRSSASMRASLTGPRSLLHEGGPAAIVGSMDKEGGPVGEPGVLAQIRAVPAGDRRADQGTAGACLELTPRIGYVQAKGERFSGDPPPTDAAASDDAGVEAGDGHFPVQFRFCPSMHLLRDSKLAPHVQLLGPEEGLTAGCEAPLRARITVPMTIRGVDQTLPIQVLLRASLSLPSLAVTPKLLRFGPCAIGQAASASVTLHNQSWLPQRFGVVRLPRGFSAVTGEGFGVLLPGERRDVELRFQPWRRGSLEASLEFLTTMGKSSHVRVTGTGVEPAVRLSLSCIKFPSLAAGEVSTAVLHAKNLSDSEPAELQCLLPPTEDCGLSAHPKVATVPPGGSVALQIECRPTARLRDHLAIRAGLPPATPPPQPPSDVAAASSTMSSVPALPGVGDGDAPQRAGSPSPRVPQQDLPRALAAWEEPSWLDVTGPRVDPSSLEPDAVYASWRLLVASRRAGQANADDAGSAAANHQCVDVSYALTQRVLQVSRTRLGFGAVAVGGESVRSLTVRNTSPQPLPLRASGLSPAGCFKVINAPRVLAPQQEMELRVAFKPSTHQVFSDTLVLAAADGGAEVTVELGGEGLSPSVSLDPSGHVDLGNVLAGDQSTRTVKLTNTSPFSLEYDVERLGQPQTNRAPSRLFGVTPTSGELGPGESVELAVTFSPDHATGPLRRGQEFLIRVPHLGHAPPRLLATGRTWAHSMYLLPEVAGGGNHAARRSSSVAVAGGLGMAAGGGGAAGTWETQAMEAAVSAKPADSASAQGVQLSFPPVMRGQAEVSVEVGRLQRPAGLSDGREPGRFEAKVDLLHTAGEITPPPSLLKMFQVTPSEGELQPGDATRVSVVFRPDGRFTPQSGEEEAGAAAAAAGADGGATERRAAATPADTPAAAAFDLCGVSVGRWVRAQLVVSLAGGVSSPAEDAELAAATLFVAIPLETYLPASEDFGIGLLGAGPSGDAGEKEGDQ